MSVPISLILDRVRPMCPGGRLTQKLDAANNFSTVAALETKITLPAKKSATNDALLQVMHCPYLNPNINMHCPPYFFYGDAERIC